MSKAAPQEGNGYSLTTYFCFLHNTMVMYDYVITHKYDYIII